MSLFDAGIAALQASGNPTDKAGVAKAISTLKTPTTVGTIDFTKGPVPNCVNTPIIGSQWVKAKPGGKFKLDFVITENANDKNVPVQAPSCSPTTVEPRQDRASPQTGADPRRRRHSPSGSAR